MPLIALAIVGALAVAMVRGARPSNVAPLALWRPTLLIVFPLAQVLAQAITGPLRIVLASGSTALLVLWLGRNAALHRGRVASGLLTTMLGTVANLIPMLTHGGMPVSRWALQVAGIAADTDVARGHLGKHVGLDAHRFGWWLGDIVPVPGLRLVASPGDFVMMIGLAIFVVGVLEPVISDSDSPQILTNAQVRG